MTALIGTHQLADPGDLRLHEVPRRPVGSAAADLEQEVVEDLTAARGVSHLGMELDPERAARSACSIAAIGELSLRGGDAVSGRRDVHVVAVAHPDRRLLALAEPEEQSAAFDPDAGPAVLPAVGAG